MEDPRYARLWGETPSSTTATAAISAKPQAASSTLPRIHGTPAPKRSLCQSFTELRPEDSPNPRISWGQCAKGLFGGQVRSCNECLRCGVYVPSDPGSEFGLYVMTCPGRDQVLSQTLASLQTSDWPEDPIVMPQPPDLSGTDRYDLSSRNYKRILQAAWDGGHAYTLILEDDVLVTPRLWHNLQNWWPIRSRQLHFGSLFLPDTIQNPWERVHDDAGYRLARRELVHGSSDLWQKHRVWGSQAYVWSRAGLWAALTQWDGLAHGQDARAFTLAHQMGWPLWYSPRCWVEHNPQVSAFDTPQAYALDFTEESHNGPTTGAYRHPEAVPGWLAYDEGRLLWDVCRGKEVLELGRHQGRSTCAIAQSGALLVSVDRASAEPARRWVSRFAPTANVRYLVRDFQDAPRQPFEVVFLDGEHDADSVERDLRQILEHPPETLVLHDYADPAHPGMRRVDRVLRPSWRKVAQAGYLAVWRPVSDARFGLSPQNAHTADV